ncbi:unnamed protein product, partial [Mesorhabditis spiculigera]
MVPWIFFLLLVAVDADHFYKGYKLVEVSARNRRDLAALSKLYTEHNVDFIRKARQTGQKAVLLLSPPEVDQVLHRLNATGSAFRVSEARFTAEPASSRQRRSIASAPLQNGEKKRAFALDDYHDYDEQVDFITDVATAHPDFVKLDVMGQSWARRDIKYLTIGYPAASQKPAFFIDAGIHAREWIAPATALWIINELTNSTKYKALLQQIDIIIVPNLNPDGYTFTRRGARMWRKNLTPQSTGCYGVDLNRNFPYYFGYSGVENNQCSEIWPGPNAASEPETKTLKSYLDQNKDRIKAYVTLHSYGQNWVYPWGYASHTYPADVQDLIDLGNAASAAIAKVRGTKYNVENSADGMYPAAGASDDYAKSIGIKYVYTVELPPGDNDSQYDFILPTCRIIPSASEVFQGLLVVAEKVACL